MDAVPTVKSEDIVDSLKSESDSCLAVIVVVPALTIVTIVPLIVATPVLLDV